MTGILSLITYSPLIGVAAILILRAFAKDDAGAARAARWIALATTMATLALSVLLVARFDPNVAGFQFVEERAWLGQVLTATDGCEIVMHAARQDVAWSRHLEQHARLL